MIETNYIQDIEKFEASAAITGAIIPDCSETATPNLEDRTGHDTDHNVIDEKKNHHLEPEEREEHESIDSREDEDVHHDLEAAPTQSSIGPVYSVFSHKQRLFIVIMASIGGFFSPLSATIYLPALNPIATDLGVSSSSVTLTITTYMIFQGLAPSLMGDLADFAGRRPVFIIGFLIYIGACIGIALQDSFTALLILRMVQSSGSSSFVALSAGIAADVSTSAERGSYMGWVTSGMLLGPAIGPIIGGLLSQFLGWRAIFWFLVILAGVYLVPFLITFPETGRNVVGNGSILPQSYNMSLLNWLQARKVAKAAGTLHRTESLHSMQSQREQLAKQRKVRWPNPLKTLSVLMEKDIALLLCYNSLVYTAFYCVTASQSYLFNLNYGFDELQIGLTFLPFGVGSLIAPLMNGRILDWNFRRVAKKEGIVIDKKRGNRLKDFPLELARVPVALPLVLIGDAAILCYGWVMQVNTNLAVPLVLQFIMGLTLTGSFNVMSVMLVDNYPQSPATATAANNFCRCLVGAGGTAVIIYMIEGMGKGWCFTFIALIVLFSSSILLILMRWGPGWRRERAERMERKTCQEAALG